MSLIRITTEVISFYRSQEVYLLILIAYLACLPQEPYVWNVFGTY